MLIVMINLLEKRPVSNGKPQDKFLDLVYLFLRTIWYTFNSQFYQQTYAVAMWDPTSTTAEIYM